MTLLLLSTTQVWAYPAAISIATAPGTELSLRRQTELVRDNISDGRGFNLTKVKNKKA